MLVIVVGAGEVGFNIANKLVGEGRDVVIIDTDEEILNQISSSLDIKTILGNGASPGVLKKAGIEKADMLIAVTNNDETNMISCLIAKSQAKAPIKIARILNPEIIYNSKITGRNYIDIDYVINPKRETALVIERLLQIPEAAEVFDYLNGKLKLFGHKFDKSNPLVGKTLKDIRKEKFGFHFLIIAILRENKVIVPTGKNTIHEGDVVYTMVENEFLPKLLATYKILQRPIEKVIILGGGNSSETLSKRLAKMGVNVKIIEKDKKKCEQLAIRLDNIMILNGNATDQELLIAEGITKVDAFISISNDEETNILSCLLASKLGAKRVIPLVNKIAYLSLIEKIGINTYVQPRQIIINGILKYLRRGKMLSVSAIGEDQAETMETQVSPGSTLIGKPLNSLNIPKGALIGAIMREEKAFIPTGDDIFKANDKLIIFALKTTLKTIEQNLISKLSV